MNTKPNVDQLKPQRTHERKRTGLAIKAARLCNGLRQQDLARTCCYSRQNLGQIESGIKAISDSHLRRIVDAIGITWGEFLEYQKDPNKFIKDAISIKTKATHLKKPRRNTFKKITKEVRVLKILRERMNISQCEASRLCDYSRCSFGQIEHGRIELDAKRISLILSKLGIAKSEFDKLMRADALKDEILRECTTAMKQLDDEKLDSILLIIKSFTKVKGV